MSRAQGREVGLKLPVSVGGDHHGTSRLDAAEREGAPLRVGSFRPTHFRGSTRTSGRLPASALFTWLGSETDVGTSVTLRKRTEIRTY